MFPRVVALSLRVDFVAVYLKLDFAEREHIVFSLSIKGSSNHIGMQRLLAYIKSE